MNPYIVGGLWRRNINIILSSVLPEGLVNFSPTELQLQAAAWTTGQVGKKVFKNGKKNKTNAKNKWQYDKL
jgi:hypothetical protein